VIAAAFGPVHDREGDQVAGAGHVRADAPQPVGGRQRVCAVADPVDVAAGQVGIAVAVQVLVDFLAALAGGLLTDEGVVGVQVDVDGVIHTGFVLVDDEDGRALFEQGFQHAIDMRAEVVDAALAGGREGVGVVAAAERSERGAQRAVRVGRQLIAGAGGAGVGIIRGGANDAHAVLDEGVAEIVVIREAQHGGRVERDGPAVVRGGRVGVTGHRALQVGVGEVDAGVIDHDLDAVTGIAQVPRGL